MNIRFTKMHGLGNDFVVIDNMNGNIAISKKQIIFLCDRNKGVGADGVVLVESSSKADFFMNYYNSDGTIAEMCGNGVRCVARFIKDRILKIENNFRIDTRAGVKNIEYKNDGTFSVNMGKPVFSHVDFPVESQKLLGLEIYFVSMGNPHAVAFVNNAKDFELSVVGPQIENNPIFPNKINFHIVEKKNNREFKVSTWERGCGVTLACGTGACAVYVVARKYQNADAEIKTELPGGDLFISENNDGEVIMRGPAVSVFSSNIEV